MTPLVRRGLLAQIVISYAIATLSTIAWVAILALFFGATGEAGGLAALAFWMFLGIGVLAALCGVVSHAWYLKDNSRIPPRVDSSGPGPEAFVGLIAPLEEESSRSAD